jgi:hypothetical protein
LIKLLEGLKTKTNNSNLETQIKNLQLNENIANKILNAKKISNAKEKSLKINNLIDEYTLEKQNIKATIEHLITVLNHILSEYKTNKSIADIKNNIPSAIKDLQDNHNDIYKNIIKNIDNINEIIIYITTQINEYEIELDNIKTEMNYKNHKEFLKNLNSKINSTNDEDLVKELNKLSSEIILTKNKDMTNAINKFKKSVNDNKANRKSKIDALNTLITKEEEKLHEYAENLYPLSDTHKKSTNGGTLVRRKNGRRKRKLNKTVKKTAKNYSSNRRNTKRNNGRHRKQTYKNKFTTE